MSAFDAYPLGKPAFVTHTLDRAAHFRTNDDKLLALESQSNARAYVVYRDSLVMKQEESGPRALLSIKGPEHAAVLKEIYGIDGFIEAGDGDYQPVRDAMALMNLKPPK